MAQVVGITKNPTGTIATTIVRIKSCGLRKSLLSQGVPLALFNAPAVKCRRAKGAPDPLILPFNEVEIFRTP